MQTLFVCNVLASFFYPSQSYKHHLRVTYVYANQDFPCDLSQDALR